MSASGSRITLYPFSMHSSIAVINTREGGNRHAAIIRPCSLRRIESTACPHDLDGILLYLSARYKLNRVAKRIPGYKSHHVVKP